MSAVFSPCRTYRYALRRKAAWGERKLLVIGLNPSVADETVNDPTIVRLIERAKRGGFGELLVGNCFAYRATDPQELRNQADPVGFENNTWLLRLAAEADLIIAGWGTNAAYRDRQSEVLKLLSIHDLYCLAVTKHGFPKHPLYVGYGVMPVLWKRKLR